MRQVIGIALLTLALVFAAGCADDEPATDDDPNTGGGGATTGTGNGNGGTTNTTPMPVLATTLEQCTVASGPTGTLDAFAHVCTFGEADATLGTRTFVVAEAGFAGEATAVDYTLCFFDEAGEACTSETVSGATGPLTLTHTGDATGLDTYFEALLVHMGGAQICITSFYNYDQVPAAFTALDGLSCVEQDA